jgi:opacity protein-like surface antigen
MTEVLEHMRFTLAASLIFVLLFSMAALAQEASQPKIQVFGGYSLLHSDTAGLTGSDVDSLLGTTGSGVNSNSNGWNAELQYNVRPWLGTVADFSGNYGKAISPAAGSGVSAPSFSSYSFLFGPEIHAQGKLRPFAHALFGTNRISSSATAASALFGTSPATSSDTAFAMALGGGLDYKVAKGFAVRLGQFDYLYTAHNALAYSGALFGTESVATANDRQNNLRFSAGLVFGF